MTLDSIRGLLLLVQTIKSKNQMSSKKKKRTRVKFLKEPKSHTAPKPGSEKKKSTPCDTTTDANHILGLHQGAL
jgi:hypothetical protein